MLDALRLKSIELKGFKSIDTEGQTIELGPVTVLLGANGAGKSNLVSFFKMLNRMTDGGLQNYVADHGFADSLLYMGAKVTSEISALLSFESSAVEGDYSFVLGRDATGNLYLKDETIKCHFEGKNTPQKVLLGGGVRESQLKERAEAGKEACRFVYNLLSQCRVFQFHDTSSTSKIRNAGYIDDARFLRSDAGNLAAFLKAMRKRSDGEKYYDRIARHIRQAIPQFRDFDLEPSAENENYIRLNYREKGRNHLFGPHQLSDGSLRFMALTVLFLQPPELRPKVIIVDEPELGLHPAAISALAGMAKAASGTAQVIFATQSPRLIDEFSADQVMIVERDEKRQSSVFRRLRERDLELWLDEYCLSELWEKNVLGGRP